MKIIVIEMNYHAEVINSLCPILYDMGHEVSLITTEQIFGQTDLSDKQLKNLVLSDGSNQKVFLSRQQEFINSQDLALFTTLHDKFEVWDGITIGIKKAVIVHNVNAFFARNNISPRWSLFFLWKDLSYFIRVILLKNDWYYRPRVLNRVDKFIFPSNQMIAFAKSLQNVDHDRILDMAFSWARFSYPSTHQTSDIVNVTIVGTIDQRKREYSIVLNCIKFLSDQRLTQKIKFTLLGKPYGHYGKRVVKEARSLHTKNIEVETFDGFVSMEKYHKLMLNTSFLIMPLVKKTRHHIWEEEYGKTKITGSVTDMVRYAKPVIVPSFYELPEPLRKCSVAYEDQNSFNQQVLNWIESRDFEKTNVEGIKKSYSVENMQYQLKEILDQI